MRSLLLELLEVTEKAALASYPWIGRGDTIAADDAATEAMREKLNKIGMEAVVVIGEGEMDEAPMLYIGEKLGLGTGPQLDIAVDPLEGTNVMSNGKQNAIAVIALAPKGMLLHAPDMYMEKISVGPKAAGKVDLTVSIVENLQIVAESLGKGMKDMTVAIQDRERHRVQIEQIRNAGARVQLFEDGDVMYSVAPAIKNSGIDMFYGIGGAPEGVISAVALKGLGGDFQSRLQPSNEEEYNRCLEMGLSNPSAVLKMNELVNSNQCLFLATGITESFLLKGVQERGCNEAVTHSVLVYGAEKRLQFIETVHDQSLAD